MSGSARKPSVDLAAEAELPLLPGYASHRESLAAIEQTSPELALMTLMCKSSGDEFVCIGRDETGQPTVMVVPGEAFLAWLDERDQARQSLN